MFALPVAICKFYILLQDIYFFFFCTTYQDYFRKSPPPPPAITSRQESVSASQPSPVHPTSWKTHQTRREGNVLSPVMQTVALVESIPSRLTAVQLYIPSSSGGKTEINRLKMQLKRFKQRNDAEEKNTKKSPVSSKEICRS